MITPELSRAVARWLLLSGAPVGLRLLIAEARSDRELLAFLPVGWDEPLASVGRVV